MEAGATHAPHFRDMAHLTPARPIHTIENGLGTIGPIAVLAPRPRFSPLDPPPLASRLGPMSEVQQVPGATIPAGGDGGDPLAPLTGRVRDMAALASTVAGRAHAIARGHGSIDGHDAMQAEASSARAQMCDAVSILATHLRRAGLPPQRMLVIVKDAVRAAAPSAGEALAMRDLMNDAVRCGITAYYAVTS